MIPRKLLFILLCLLAPSFGYPEEKSGEYLTLKIALIGPGDELYFWWGHIALVIEDARTGKAVFYDYGQFSFENKNFFTNFALGRLLYTCGASPAEGNYRIYAATNRDITVYTLDVAPEKREEVRKFAEHNVLPENKDYYYHHFRDNCATRIRDIIDLAVDGQFKERYGNAPGRFTLRQHVRRHTWFSPFMDWLLNFLMGQGIDKPITMWEEMFLPSEIVRDLRDFRYRDPAGEERLLVEREEVLHRARNRPAVLEAPRTQGLWEGPVGLVIAGALLFCGLLARNRPKPYRLIFGLSQSLLGLFFGGGGAVLFFMTFFTDHDYTYHNSNLLYVSPLLLAAVPLGWVFGAGKTPKKRFFAEQLLRAIWTYMFFGCILSMVIKLFPGFYQQNQATQVLTFPFALTLSFIPTWIGRKGGIRGS
ncbi:MAG: DUF4105 domain-containing protein [Spirochaetaceae bacterium]|jgi:hypothetical protein|nr:DUF4105 domain-containing protein [Spirochaetaceae bacterium]